MSTSLRDGDVNRQTLASGYSDEKESQKRVTNCRRNNSRNTAQNNNLLWIMSVQRLPSPYFVSTFAPTTAPTWTTCMATKPLFTRGSPGPPLYASLIFEFRAQMSTGVLKMADLSQLSTIISGTVIIKSENAKEYEKEVKRTWNAVIQSRKPCAFVKVASVEDVANTVKFCVTNKVSLG